MHPLDPRLTHHHPNRAPFLASLPDGIPNFPCRDGLGALILAANKKKTLHADARKSHQIRSVSLSHEKMAQLPWRSRDLEALAGTQGLNGQTKEPRESAQSGLPRFLLIQFPSGEGLLVRVDGLCKLNLAPLPGQPDAPDSFSECVRMGRGLAVAAPQRPLHAAPLPSEGGQDALKLSISRCPLLSPQETERERWRSTMPQL